MMKKQLALLLACLMLFTLTACGGESPAAPNEGTSQSSDSGQENIETPQGEEEESVPSFSVPTQNDPPAVYEGINMVNLGPGIGTRLNFWDQFLIDKVHQCFAGRSRRQLVDIHASIVHHFGAALRHDGEQFANERQLSGGGMKLLDVRYVFAFRRRWSLDIQAYSLKYARYPAAWLCSAHGQIPHRNGY